MRQLRKDKTWAMLTQIVMPMIESIKIDYWLMGFYIKRVKHIRWSYNKNKLPLPTVWALDI